jgi:hypothetical protein
MKGRLKPWRERTFPVLSIEERTKLHIYTFSYILALIGTFPIMHAMKLLLTFFLEVNSSLFVYLYRYFLFDSILCDSFTETEETDAKGQVLGQDGICVGHFD